MVAIFPLDGKSMLLPLGRWHGVAGEAGEGGPNCRLCHVLAKGQV